MAGVPANDRMAGGGQVGSLQPMARASTEDKCFSKCAKMNTWGNPNFGRAHICRIACAEEWYSGTATVQYLVELLRDKGMRLPLVCCGVPVQFRVLLCPCLTKKQPPEHVHLSVRPLSG